jgi:hypothetical protein
MGMKMHPTIKILPNWVKQFRTMGLSEQETARLAGDPSDSPEF